MLIEMELENVYPNRDKVEIQQMKDTQGTPMILISIVDAQRPASAYNYHIKIDSFKRFIQEMIAKEL